MTTPVPVHHDSASGPAAGNGADVRPGLVSRLSAEAFGSLFIVVAGLGVPLFSIPQSSPLPSALAAGLAVTAAMLAFGYVSGGHFNPAVTVGHAVRAEAAADRLDGVELHRVPQRVSQGAAQQAAVDSGLQRGRASARVSAHNSQFTVIRKPKAPGVPRSIN